jgi:hypothetical protein
MNLGKLTLLVGVVLTLGAFATAASAGSHAKPLTGIWSGKTHQDIAPLGEDADFVEWEQRIVVRAYMGRLVSVSTNVRYTCPDPATPMAGDIAVNLHWRLGKGPRLNANGGFSLVIRESTNVLTGKVARTWMPVQLNGRLGQGGASGRFDMSRADCSGKGRWQARRTSTI